MSNNCFFRKYFIKHYIVNLKVVTFKLAFVIRPLNTYKRKYFFCAGVFPLHSFRSSKYAVLFSLNRKGNVHTVHFLSSSSKQKFYFIFSVWEFIFSIPEVYYKDTGSRVYNLRPIHDLRNVASS